MAAVVGSPFAPRILISAANVHTTVADWDTGAAMAFDMERWWGAAADAVGGSVMVVWCACGRWWAGHVVAEHSSPNKRGPPSTWHLVSGGGGSGWTDAHEPLELFSHVLVDFDLPAADPGPVLAILDPDTQYSSLLSTSRCPGLARSGRRTV